jgi:hypothetical protein
MSLSPEQEKDCTEAFSLFDRAGAGKLKIAEISSVMRALGHNLAGDELKVRRPSWIQRVCLGFLEFRKKCKFLCACVRELPRGRGGQLKRLLR